ncbi:dirigent protein 1-like [Musa acuminata AAA Group]|uniref:dirigent protein 1-like n=1 Tax=Musa acuminata AAA Group TaxID=214697 RepID=UPI0031D097DC
MASSPHSSSHLYLLLVLFPLLAAATALPVTSEFELGIQKRIHFRVYFHETFLGPDNTTVTVVNMSLPYTFGDVDIFDAVLRIGPSQRDESSLVLVFTAGNFCDSTLTVIGRMDACGKADQAIVGGTGVFQFASGNVVSKQVTSDVAGLVVAFVVYVMYHNDVRLTSIA